MSQTIEVQVIDDKLLLEGICEAESYVNEKVALQLKARNLVEVSPNAEALVLSFKRIGKIENIIGFDKITKLCLDNNFIENIASLGHLTSLRWLDLSFNKIRDIKGLEKLTQLEDLSLCSNKIATIEGLEKCSNLQCFSIGNNRIDSLEQVIRLRQLGSLRMLTLSDNPICKEPEYKMIVLAYVDTIKYLDYALIDPTERAVAKEQYHDELLDVEEKESVITEKAARDSSLDKYMKELDKACILFSHTIFDDLFSEDKELERLKHMPGIKEQIENFRNAFKSMSEEFIKEAMERYSKKLKEVDDFERTVREVRNGDDLDSTTLIDGFKKSQKAQAHYITENGDNISSTEGKEIVKRLQEELEKVCDELMNLELRQVEKFDALVDHFENRLTEFKIVSLECQTGFFRNIEELEEKFSTGSKAVAQDLMDRLAREELAEDFMDDEAMMLITDRESCMQLFSASHDMHIGRILNREDQAKAAENRKFVEDVARYTKEENIRNRDRILQIHEFARLSRISLLALLSEDDDEGGDFDDHIEAVNAPVSR